MTDAKDKLIEKLYHERSVTNATLDLLLATLAYNRICPDCGASLDDCTEESCEDTKAKVLAWVGDLDELILGENENGC